MSYTKQEVDAAKKMRSIVIESGSDAMKAVYMAGEICMWDEMQQKNTNSPPETL